MSPHNEDCKQILEDLLTPRCTKSPCKTFIVVVERKQGKTCPNGPAESHETSTEIMQRELNTIRLIIYAHCSAIR